MQKTVLKSQNSKKSFPGVQNYNLQAKKAPLIERDVKNASINIKAHRGLAWVDEPCYSKYTSYPIQYICLL